MSQLSCGIYIPGVTEKNGRYYKVIKNKWVPLTRIDEGIDQLYRCLSELDPLKPGTIGQLIDLYRAMGMDELSEATKKDYRNILIRLQHHFGRMTIDTLEPNRVAHFLEVRRKAGKGGKRANREVAVLSAVHQFGMRNLYCRFNPVRGVSRNKESASRAYVTDQEFLDVFNRCGEPLQDLLAVAYLSAIRQTDLLVLSRSQHLTPAGIKYTQSKTKKDHTVAWSDALRFFVRRAMERHPGEDLVFLNYQGKPWTTTAIASQLDRRDSPWPFKRLRSKAQTDSPHSVLGHGAALENLYRKQLRTSPVR